MPSTMLFVVTYRREYPTYYMRNVPFLVDQCLKQSICPVIVTNRSGAIMPSIENYVHRSSELIENYLLRVLSYGLGFGRHLESRTHVTLILRKLFKDYDFDACFLSPDMGYFGVTAAKLAQQHGIVSILIVNGLMRMADFYSFTASHIAAYGEHAHEILVHAGVSENRIIVTGMPYWDHLHSLSSPNGKGILYATENLDFETTLHNLRILASMTDVQVYVKPHPAEKSRMPIYQKYATKNLHILDSQLPIVDLIRGSESVLIESHSNVGLEAMLLHKPVAILNGDRENEVYPWLSSNSAFNIELSDPFSFHKFIEDQSLREELKGNASSFLGDWLRLDGDSARRMIALGAS